jgi:DNA replication initiation complex subunit (GINS family)
MAEETITYELIRKIQREEEKQPKLTKLPDDFYSKVGNYLIQKRRMSATKSDRKDAFEVKNVERLIEDIFSRRERKILNHAIIAARTGIVTENLTEEESNFHFQILQSLKERRMNILKKVLEQMETKEGMVVFKQESPAFVGSDMLNYGPFKEGDVAKIPEDNKKLLIEKGLVEEIK